IVGAALLVLISVGITLLANLVQKTSGSLSGLAGGVLLHGATFLLSIVVVLLLYRFVPARGIRIHDGLAGAILTAILLLLISLASSWIYNKTTQLSVVYGSLPSAPPLLHSMYLYASALLVAAQAAPAWGRPPATPRQ